MVIPDKTYSADEFIVYAEQHSDQILELIDGRIIEKVTTEEHGYIVINIGSALKIWLKTASVNGYYSTEASLKVAGDDSNVRRPDVSFRITDDSISKKGALLQMPDLTVEVKSVSNTYQELRQKARYYLANGSRLVWLVYPVKQIVEVYYPDMTSDLFNLSDMLDGGDVLPGFKMTVREVLE